MFVTFEQNSCFASKMFEQKSMHRFEQKSFFTPKMLEQKSCFAPKMFVTNVPQQSTLVLYDVQYVDTLGIQMYDVHIDTYGPGITYSC